LRKNLAIEQIYDAAFDDEALRALAVDLGRNLGARSALIHWIHADGSADVLAHSGYFTDEQLGLYARDFAAIDPWVHATAAPELANQVYDLEEFVPSTVFAASDFYNDYVRAMGDDTGRCLGVRLHSAHGSGFIALQRGIRQPSFDSITTRRLQHYSAHLMRMLAWRGRLLSAQRRSDELAALIDGIGRPALLVDSSFRVRQSNHAAELMLQAGTFLSAREGVLTIDRNGATDRLRNSVEQVLATGEPTAISLGNEDTRQVEVSVTAVATQSGPRLALILLSGAIDADTTRSARLRSMYGLSAGEACLAGMLADGMSPAEIAETRRVAVGTVRFQIKQIALKLGCHRQTDIVRIVCSLPPLRSGPTT
jgi:DNA-binding CsgD family transcriptional regulator